MDTVELWDNLLKSISACAKCGLASSRTNTVPGEGNRNARLMFVGEGPGRDEDLSGRPFVGKAGQLLDKAISAIGLTRGQVYIANIVKCRPPGNRLPTDEEAYNCLPYLRRQVFLIRPLVLVSLGATATRHILGGEIKITQIRGIWIERKGISIMPTYHPAALLRDEHKKKDFWIDFIKIREKLKEIETS